MDDVHFSYGTGSEVLSGVDLEVAPGEIVAVCGATGAGKTTLLNLLPRFYDPAHGRVLIGGVDSRDVALAELRRSVALVTQKPVLFSVPLRDNLLAARPDADWVDVLAACEAAGVAAFVDGLPDGYDTLIGERGVNLSGGQRQRVALARALIAQSRVIVLDDPMSAVDTETGAPPRCDSPARRRGPHRPDRQAAAVDDPRRRPCGRAPGRAHRREWPAARADRSSAAPSPTSSETRPLPRKRRTGLSAPRALHGGSPEAAQPS